MPVAQTLFWLSAALLLYTLVGYGALLAAVVRLRGTAGAGRNQPTAPAPARPRVAVIVAAYTEAGVIAGRIANLRALDYPRDRYEVVICCDGSPDETAALARAAGADRVLELPRGGKIRAQDAGVRATDAELVAFTDANALWAPDALTQLVAAFTVDPRVGYACGQVRFLNNRGDNQEGLYWRYEMWLRRLESAAGSITAGNGAIYATRREAYVEVDPVMGHDLSFPFNLVKRGWRCVYVPAARAEEKMVPSIDGEFARKRRMMSHTWAIVLRGGMLSPRGYPPLFALEILSHRILRYGAPFLHAVALITSVVLAPTHTVYAVALIAQLALFAAAALAPMVRIRATLIARYYLLTTLSPALGLFDLIRHGVEAGWEPAEGTR